MGVSVNKLLRMEKPNLSYLIFLKNEAYAKCTYVAIKFLGEIIRKRENILQTFPPLIMTFKKYKTQTKILDQKSHPQFKVQFTSNNESVIDQNYLIRPVLMYCKQRLLYWGYAKADKFIICFFTNFLDTTGWALIDSPPSGSE